MKNTLQAQYLQRAKDIEADRERLRKELAEAREQIALLLEMADQRSALIEELIRRLPETDEEAV